MWHFYIGNYSQIYFDICNYICLDTSYHFRLYLYFLNIVLYFFKYDCINIFHRRSLCTFYIVWAIDIESICTKIPKRINWYSQHIVSFHCNDITLTVSIGNVLYSQSHDTVEHTAKLKTSSPWASALVLSFDFRGSTNDQTTTKVALSAVEMPLRRYASRTNLLGFEIYFTEDFEPTNQNWGKYHVTLLTALSIKAQKSLLYIWYDNRFVLTWKYLAFIISIRFHIEYSSNLA